jgi:long-chain acyl-CoA synthetase
MDKWTPEGMLEAIETHRVTSTFMVPTHFHRLLELPEEIRGRFDLSSLRHVVHGGAPCALDVKRRMLEWWGPVIYEVYSAAELRAGLRVGPEEWLAHPGTVGKATSSVGVLRDDGSPCEAREVGTIHVDGIAPGDLGWLDEDGYLYFSDRKVDMVISGGVNVYPAEIEAVLAMHAGVADVAVFGIPDDEWGERLTAVVQPRSGVEAGDALAEDLQRFCRERLAGPKCPRSFDFVDALPRDATGKLRKRALRDPYWHGRPRRIGEEDGCGSHQITTRV